MKKLAAVLLGLVLLCVSVISIAESDTWICTHCGKESFGSFCAWCGTKKLEDKAVCPACGTEYDPSAGYAFCTACGASLAASTPDPSYELFDPFATFVPDVTPTPTPDSLFRDENTPVPDSDWQPWGQAEATPVAVQPVNPISESLSLEGTWRLVRDPNRYYGMDNELLLDEGGTITLTFENGQMSVAFRKGSEIHESDRIPYIADEHLIKSQGDEIHYHLGGTDLALEMEKGKQLWLFEKLDSFGSPVAAPVTEEMIRGTWKAVDMTLVYDGEKVNIADRLRSGEASMIFTFADGKYTQHESQTDYTNDRDGEYRIENGRLWLDNSPGTCVFSPDGNTFTLYDVIYDTSIMMQRQ